MHRRDALAAVAGLGLGLLTGCAGRTAASTPPIRVGVLHSLSGTMAISERSLVDATLLGLQEINDAGGLLGRPVEPVVVDGRSRALDFAEQARRLVDGGVAAIFGCWTSSSRKLVKPVVERGGCLLFYPVAYEGLETSPNIVYLGSASLMRPRYAKLSTESMATAGA